MDIPMHLTLEQQFQLRIYQEQVYSLSQEQAQEFLVEVLRQMMVKDNLLKHFLKKAA